MNTSQQKQRILLTGATGYIGRRLKHKLLDDSNVQLRLLVRHGGALSESIREQTKVFEGSTFDIEPLSKAMQGVEVAYYLIHSLGNDDYAERDRVSARNFREAAVKAGVKKIIYLGGLGVINEDTSEHLLSRIETGEILSADPDNIDVIWFRAGVIIGSGSASFEIIRNLIQKLPVMITPKWVRTKAQPIGVEDVISYLKHAKSIALTNSHIVDIGAEQLCYQEMMQQCAEVMGLKRLIIPAPFLSIGLSSYWLNIFTPVPFNVASSLIKGVRSEVIVQNDNAKKLFGHERRDAMKGACFNCHSSSFVDNFYIQFDDLVVLYNEKFARPAKKFMDDLKADGVLKPDAPFEHPVQWDFWELWHHEGRRARHGASMMGPDYTHWHGMYEVAKHYYMNFLPGIIEAAATKNPEMEEKYQRLVDEHLAQEEHTWMKGLSAEEAEALRKMYQDRYGE